MERLPERVTTAESAARALARVWASVESGDLHPPREDEARARETFGVEGVSIVPGEPHLLGGPVWPSATEAPSRAALWGLFGRGDVVAPDALPAALYRRPGGSGRSGRFGISWSGAYADEPITASWSDPVHKNAPRSAERARVGVEPPPYAPSPSGTHRAAVSVLTARALAVEVLSAADSAPRASLSRALRSEASAYVAYANDVEALIDTTSRSWLPDAARWIAAPKSGAVAPTVPAQLRRT